MSRRTRIWWEAEGAGEIPAAMQAPGSQPGTPGDASGFGNPAPGNQQVPGGQQQQQQGLGDTQDDVTADPRHPEMPEPDNANQDFEEWKNEFFKLSIKGDPNEMISAIKQVRDRDLDPTQRKFVEDNIQIQYFRQDHNILEASKDIRKMMRNQLDRNYPASNIATYISFSLEKYPDLTQILYKLPGFYGMKGDLHRKFVGALLCAVQVGGGGNSEDLVYTEQDFGINISTRFSTEWGEIPMGRWNLQADDPQKYLEEPELARLHDGSPEEKQVLRHRIVLSSMAERFQTRAFIVHVTTQDGIINTLGWDLGDSLTGGYVDGYLKVRAKQSEGQDAMIDRDGNVIKITDEEVKFVKKTGKHDQVGKPIQQEVDFLRKINGMLYFSGTLNTLRAMSSSLQGVTFKETPFNGNPSDLKDYQRCIPSLEEMLMRKC